MNGCKTVVKVQLIGPSYQDWGVQAVVSVA